MSQDVESGAGQLPIGDEGTFEFDSSEMGGYTGVNNYEDFGGDDASMNLEQILAAQNVIAHRKK